MIFLVCRVYCHPQRNHHQLQRPEEILGEQISFVSSSRCFFLSDGRRDQLSVSPSLQESKGYEFESETDTETIPKLVKYMYDNRESDDLSFATLVERVIQQLVRTCSCSPLLAAAREMISRVRLTCSFFRLPGGSFCLGLQKCPLPWRGSWHKVTSELSGCCPLLQMNVGSSKFWRTGGEVPC